MSVKKPLYKVLSMFMTLNHGCDGSSCQVNVIFNLESEGYTKFNFLNIYFRRFQGILWVCRVMQILLVKYKK